MNRPLSHSATKDPIRERNGTATQTPPMVPDFTRETNHDLLMEVIWNTEGHRVPFLIEIPLFSTPLVRGWDWALVGPGPCPGSGSGAHGHVSDPPLCALSHWITHYPAQSHTSTISRDSPKTFIYCLAKMFGNPKLWSLNKAPTVFFTDHLCMHYAFFFFDFLKIKT